MSLSWKHRREQASPRLATETAAAGPGSEAGTDAASSPGRDLDAVFAPYQGVSMPHQRRGGTTPQRPLIVRFNAARRLK